jgi:hypothetical protein
MGGDQLQDSGAVEQGYPGRGRALQRVSQEDGNEEGILNHINLKGEINGKLEDSA